MTRWRISTPRRPAASCPQPPRRAVVPSRLSGLALTAALCLTGAAADAHAFLERASPAVGSSVHGSPANLTLTYTEGVEPAFSSVAVTDAAGHRVDQDSLTTQSEGRVLVVPLQPLGPGLYAVEWHVTSVDTHQTQGHFSFTVMP